MRISRALALAGIASRRKSEEHVRNGAVSVNGEVIRDLGRQVDLNTDAVAFRGRVLEFHRPLYYVMHKPAGYLTMAHVPPGKKSIYELLPRNLISESRQPSQKRTRVFPVGLLDRDTTGLLLFTNDGEMANRLIHPRYGIGKWYQVRLSRPFDPNDRLSLLKGVRLRDGMTKIDKLIVQTRRVIHILLCEGRKKEVERVFEALDYKVAELCRTAFGPLTLSQLPPGQGRYLTAREIASLEKAVGIRPAEKPAVCNPITPPF